MPLHPIYGHESARHQLSGAVTGGRLPQALLIDGPAGVGKQRLALWLAQHLLCDTTRACAGCPGCHRVLTLGHPDLLWLIPLEFARKGADADKQVELVEEALGAEMAIRRDASLYQTPPGQANHGIAAARLVARFLAKRPALGRRKVVIIGDAERLVPQRANPEAANALLKALEEPPTDTTIILTTSEPGALLPTLMSRLVRVRVTRLPDSVVTEFAQHELKKPQREISQLVAAADGSIGRLLALEGRRTSGDEAVDRFLSASHGSAVDRLTLALAQPPFQARGAFTALLDGLLEQLRERARSGADTAQVVEAISRVLEARDAAQGNVNPQLLAAVLAEDLWTT
jgi:DNA polymerase-3 subunit delta'